LAFINENWVLTPIKKILAKALDELKKRIQGFFEEVGGKQRSLVKETQIDSDLNLLSLDDLHQQYHETLNLYTRTEPSFR